MLLPILSVLQLEDENATLRLKVAIAHSYGNG
jgi:hypothetical protein